MKFAVVIPATHGREKNLMAVGACIRDQIKTPDVVVIVDDGGMLDHDFRGYFGRDTSKVRQISAPKHEPGLEQPRNIGTRIAKMTDPDLTHVVFLDSDVVVGDDWLWNIEHACSIAGPRVLACPYDWLPPGLRPEIEGFWSAARVIENDPRWEMFHRYGIERVFCDDLSAGLACFSGNLVWPIAEFERVGGFWSEIHHGRCEDGELGLRAVSMQVPIGLAPRARGWHLSHPVNSDLAMERNARDVPMLNERHPWVERGSVYLSDRDGGAFDVHCRCGDVVPTILWWQHAAACTACMGDFALPVG